VPEATEELRNVPSAGGSPGPRGKRGLTSLDVLAGLLVLTLVLRQLLGGVLDDSAVRTWATIFVSLVIQALPFLVLGVVISAAISVLVPPAFFARALARRPALAVPVAGAAGVVLPGCECGSVPIAGGLVSRGVPPAAAFAFLLSAPAINPVVLVATAVAFPGQPSVVVARFFASLACRRGHGLVVAAVRQRRVVAPDAPPVGERAAQVGSLPRVGATRLRPRRRLSGGWWPDRRHSQRDRAAVGARRVGGNLAVSVLVLAALAVVLAICSEADAFVAASLTAFPMTARLAFMVVGPAVDVKLFALQAGTFGRGFALRFAPATFLVAVGASVLVGSVLL